MNKILMLHVKKDVLIFQRHYCPSEIQEKITPILVKVNVVILQQPRLEAKYISRCLLFLLEISIML